MDIKKVLADHAAWLADEGGKCADLRGVDLRSMDLRFVKLSGADLRFVNLRGADLRGVDLIDAKLSGADLRFTNLSDADLHDADLRDADLSGADLRFVNLSGADLRFTNLHRANLRFTNLSDTNLRFVKLNDTNLGGDNLLVLHLPLWTVYIHEKTIRIGCKHFTHEEWRNFADKEIDHMDSNALSWWITYKPMIMAAAKTMRRARLQGE